MSGAALLLDPAIRTWVVLPIVAITFLVLLGKHYLGLWMQGRPKPDLAKLTDSCVAHVSFLLFSYFLIFLFSLNR